MSFRLGLTGGIGMGKSTTAQMFRELGCPVWDADEAVHRLYAAGGAAIGPVAQEFPDAIREDAVDREALKQILARDATALSRLEAIVHPLVAADRARFLAQNQDHPVVVLDIPLLFEAGYQDQMDGVAVVSTDPQTQRARVLARDGMTNEVLKMILARQMSDAEKRRRADWIIPTDTLDGARAAVRAILDEVAPHA